MAEKLKVDIRTEFGKGYARRIRQDNKVPAVLYGHGTDPVHLILPSHEIALLGRNPNALIELEIPNADSELAIIKDIQRHPLNRWIQHVDLLLVKRGEKVQVDIPVTVEGEPVAPAVAVVDLQTITVLADALKLPEHFVVNVEGKEEGDSIYAGDVDIEGAELVTDAELLVVAVQVPKVDEADLESPAAEDSEDAASETEAEAAESSTEE